MPKSFLSNDPFADDPFAAAHDGPAQGRRPGRPLLSLLIPALGLTLLVAGMWVKPAPPVPAGGIMTAEVSQRPEKTVRSESRAGQILSIEEARRNVAHWRRENCCGAATPHGRSKMRAWERSYRCRLELFARMYPGQACPRRKDL